MPITLKQYREKASEIKMPAMKLSLHLSTLSGKLNNMQGPEVEKAKSMVTSIGAANAFFIATPPQISEDNFAAFTKNIDLLPKLMQMQLPGDPPQTVFDLLTEDKTPKEKLDIFREIASYGRMVGIDDYLSQDEFEKKANEEKRKLQEEEQKEKDRLNSPIPEFDAKDKEGPKKTAAAHIEDLKKHQPTFENVAEVMAARLLANSVRGVSLAKTGLQDKELTSTEIKKTAELLKNDPVFMDFYWSNLKAIRKAYAKGHGGGIDDLFKETIKKLPAGKMPTDGIYTRYMPTVYERIDALKSKIKNGADPAEANRAAAEIVILRNMAGAEKKNPKTLKTKLTVEQMNRLKSDVDALAADPSFKDMMNDPTIRTQMKKGHGGDMLETMRSLQKNYPNMDANIKKLMNGTTIGERLDEVRKQSGELAKEIREELDRGHKTNTRPDMQLVWRKIDASKKLLAEYLALDNQARKTGDMESGLLKDVPKDTINKQIQNRESNQIFTRMVKDIDPKKTLQMLDDMGSLSQDQFMTKLSMDHTNAILPEENKQPTVPKQPEADKEIGTDVPTA